MLNQLLKNIEEVIEMHQQFDSKLKNSDFNNYIIFLQENFPKNIWIKEKKLIQLENFHSLVYQNLVIYDIITEHLNLNLIDTKLRFMNDYMESINTLLIALPVNYPGFANYNVRVASESLLKYLYSLTFCTKTEEEIARTQFRYLKEEPKRDPSNLNIKDELIELTKIYGRASKVIHKHKVDTNNLNATINYFVETFFEELNDIIKELNNLINIVIITVLNKINFHYEKLSFASKLRINSKLDPDKQTLMKAF